jgi:hypothetical protein
LCTCPRELRATIAGLEEMMTEETQYTELECHQKFAVDCFNHVWSLLEKADRTTEEDDEMVHSAHASRFHWGKVGTPVNLARGEWQISRVYSELSSSEPAMYHGQRCLAICQENGIGDFDLAYAYEAMARAAAVAGHQEDSERYQALSREASANIKEDDDRKLLLADLATIGS